MLQAHFLTFLFHLHAGTPPGPVRRNAGPGRAWPGRAWHFHIHKIHTFQYVKQLNAGQNYIYFLFSAFVEVPGTASAEKKIKTANPTCGKADKQNPITPRGDHTDHRKNGSVNEHLTPYLLIIAL